MTLERTAFEDFRGVYRNIFYDTDIPYVKFVEDDVSVSNKGVLRGIHGDDKTWKLITCLKGRFLLIVVCNDGGKYQGDTDYFTLSDSNNTQVLVPPKHGNGHLAMEDCIFHYKQSEYYGDNKQFTLRWDDYWWPKIPILSRRDSDVPNQLEVTLADEFE